MTATRQAVIVQGEESEEVRATARVLQEHEGEAAHLLLGDGATLVLSPVITRALQHVVDYLADGDVTIGRFDGYTPDEAMYFLGASRSYVAEALERGELPYRLHDAQVRIDHADLVAHRAKLDELMREGVRLIQQISEEEGAYDER